MERRSGGYRGNAGDGVTIRELNFEIKRHKRFILFLKKLLKDKIISGRAARDNG